MTGQKNREETLASKRHKLALALGGGGARGVAHIGVLKVLVREGIPIDMIVGTSIGALVGGAFASGQSVEDIEKRYQEFLDSPLYKDSDLRVLGCAYGEKPKGLSHRIHAFFKKNYLMAQLLRKPGLFNDKKFAEMINFFLPDISLEETVIPFYPVATDLQTGERLYLKHGSLRKAVLASCSVPGVVSPVEWEGRLLADGGIICLVPATCAKELGAEVVVAVAVDRDICSQQEFTNALDIYVRAGDIQGFYLSNSMLQEADVIIRPEVGDLFWADFSKSKELIKKGEQAAEENLELIKKALPKPKFRFSLETIWRSLHKKMGSDRHPPAEAGASSNPGAGDQG